MPIEDVFAQRVRSVIEGELQCATDPSIVEIVPGDHAGPMQMGMTRAEVEALGILRPHPHYSAMTVPYDLTYDDDGRVLRIEVSLEHVPSDVRIGEALLPRNADLSRARALLGDCVEGMGTMGRREHYLQCRAGGLSLMSGGETGQEVWIELPTLPALQFAR